MNKQKIKETIGSRFPSALYFKGWLVAWCDHFSSLKESYSQAGEDRIVDAVLAETSLDNHIFVDVGANHPTRLSNTYRLYRGGMHGIVVEPNARLLTMHRAIRKRDHHLGIACSQCPCAMEFQHAKSHVLSGFHSEDLKANDFSGAELMPCLTVDLILAAYPDVKVALLSIDVEGHDYEVLLGAVETLKRTKMVCIEGVGTDLRLVGLMEAHGFHLHHTTPHNLIFNRC